MNVAPPRAIFTKYAAWWAPLFFALYGAWGFITLADFGVGLDELTQRTIGMENNRFLSGRVGFDKVTEHGFFGPIWESLCYLAEQLYFPGSLRFKLLLHRGLLWSFFLLSCWRLYRWGIRRTWVGIELGSTVHRWVALVPALLLMTWPRLFADAHYNSKDALFLSLMIWVWTGLDERWQFVNLSRFQRVWPWLLLGISATIRLSGLIVFAIALIADFVVSYQRSEKKQLFFVSEIKEKSGLLALFAVGYISTYPYLWFTGWNGFIEILQFGANNPWKHPTLFMGELINTFENPQSRWYLPIWILVTLSEWILVLLVAVLLHVWPSNRVWKQPIVFFSLAVLFAFFWYTLLLQPVLYNGWRHLYFLAVPLVLFIGVGASAINHRKMWWMHTLLAGSLLYSLVEPNSLNNSKKTLQQGYSSAGSDFNVLASWITKSEKSQLMDGLLGPVDGFPFSGDYWQHTTLQAYRYMLEKFPKSTIFVCGKGETLWLNSWMLSAEDRKRLRFLSMEGIPTQVGEPAEFPLITLKEMQLSTENGLNTIKQLENPLVYLVFNEEGSTVRPKEKSKVLLTAYRDNLLLWTAYSFN